jgi:putative transposase
MPKKDQSIKQAIESVMGSTRKGHKKIIRFVQKQHTYLSASKIRRVYVKEGFSLMKRPRKRMKYNPTNPIMIPLQRNEEWAIGWMHV